MAKKQQQGGDDDILLNIKVTGRDDIGGAREDAKQLDDQLKKTGSADISTGAKSLKAQLREAKLAAEALFDAGKQNTEEYANAARKVQGLVNDMDELNNTFKSFDPDNKFRVFANAAGAGATAVQGYAGAMAFLGVNSEDTLESIAKLQGIMAFADAIDSLGDLQDSYKDVLRMLGLAKTGTEALQAAQAQESAVAVAGAIDQVAAEAQLAAAREAYAAADLATQEALRAARTEGIAIGEEMNGVEEIYLERARERQVAARSVREAEEALSTATQGATASTTAATGAATGLNTAQRTAAVGSRILGTALKAIGIGLVVSAVAYLVTNFDKVKKTLTDLFPALEDTGKLFDKVKEVAFGLGNVILNLLIAPAKTFIKLIQGDFKGAINEFMSSVDVVKHYTAGAAKEVAAQTEAARVDRVKKEIEANERIIKERKALGENTFKLELANKKRELSILDKEDEDYASKRAELETEITVMQNAEFKKQSDAYTAKLKEDLDKIRANAAENLKVIRANSKDQRRIEIDDLDAKYTAELAILNKRKEANKNYNKDLRALLEARKIEETNVNKKYDDAFTAYQTEAAQLYFSEYEKKEAEIKKRAEELLKTATPDQAGAIKSTEAFLLSRNESQSIAADASRIANINLSAVENINKPSDNDSPDEARAKISALTTARLEAETAAYELKRAQLEGQYNDLEQLEADHERNLTDINQENADARQAIAAAEAENRLKMFDAISQGAAVASDLIGESTLAGKALAIASATINTYAAIAGQLAAFAGVPIPGYAIAQAIATGLVGLQQVKKIMTVNVPGGSGAGSPGGSGGGSAPVINSTVLSREKSGSDDVVSAVNDNTRSERPLRAFIVNKDLEDQKEKTDYYETQSTY